MRYIISGKNLDITEGLRSAVTDKLGKLERYFTPDTEVHVTLSVEKERQKIEVTIPSKEILSVLNSPAQTCMYLLTWLKKSSSVSSASIRTNLWQDSRVVATSRKSSLRKRQMIRKLISSVPRSLISSPCILKMHVSRWNFWDITFRICQRRDR